MAAYWRGYLKERKNLLGKRIAGDYYIHRIYINRLNKEMTSLYCSAQQILSQEQNKEWNLAKINHRTRKVSFLHYPEFDKVAHPELKQSISINMSVIPPNVRVIKGGGQILHRKELFVDKDYPHYSKFAKLTELEETNGLLNKDAMFKGKKLSLIMGRRKIWEEWLKFNNVKITDHEIIKLDNE